jgi:plasmid stabilization system protein ParE
MLNRAEKTGRIVHYWLHPENVASAPATLSSLRDIVETAARMRDAGRCEILTQRSYCRTERSLSPET